MPNKNVTGCIGQLFVPDYSSANKNFLGGQNLPRLIKASSAAKNFLG
ncbi:MAG: hypothetical protein WBE14_13615 [Xanthobacteraceae bacterium]